MDQTPQDTLDPELVHVEEIEAVALGQPARGRFFSVTFLGRHLRDGGVFDERFGIERIVWTDFHQEFPITDVSWNSGR